MLHILFQTMNYLLGNARFCGNASVMGVIWAITFCSEEIVNSYIYKCGLWNIKLNFQETETSFSNQQVMSVCYTKWQNRARLATEYLWLNGSYLNVHTIPGSRIQFWFLTPLIQTMVSTSASSPRKFQECFCPIFFGFTSFLNLLKSWCLIPRSPGKGLNWVPCNS